ncbi:hypothetical protein DERF_014933 [Dermatophagoides farinae]|uniref:Uncharacterized protein n=1 Tax=Dermatophagoides farinae TaxID=6954 RepID=A0A922KXP2_DERFA|nr:hypothetical protein DERF_014933 [Dermatophagoides farinae]
MFIKTILVFNYSKCVREFVAILKILFILCNSLQKHQNTQTNRILAYHHATTSSREGKKKPSEYIVKFGKSKNFITKLSKQTNIDFECIVDI